MADPMMPSPIMPTLVPSTAFVDFVVFVLLLLFAMLAFG